MDINKTAIDIMFGASCIALLFVISFLLTVFNRAPKMLTLKIFSIFSLGASIFLFTLLCTDNTHEYVHAYFLIQSFSYLIEMAICIQLAELIIKNNWVVLLIFGPLMSALMILFVIKYSIPKRLEDVLYPGYAAASLCGFILFVVWMLQGKFENKLERPYSGIATAIGIFITIRFMIMLANNYYQSSHWNIIGRLYPINELAFLIMLMVAILPKNNIIEFPVKMTIKDLAAVCRSCGKEYPLHDKGCKYNKSKIVSIS